MGGDENRKNRIPVGQDQQSVSKLLSIWANHFPASSKYSIIQKTTFMWLKVKLVTLIICAKESTQDREIIFVTGNYILGQYNLRPGKTGNKKSTKINYHVVWEHTIYGRTVLFCTGLFWKTVSYAISILQTLGSTYSQ